MTDEHRTPIEGWGRFRMPYLQIGLVAMLAGGILSVGLLGPHPSPPQTPLPPPVTSPLVALPSPIPITTAGPDIAGLDGLARFNPAPADVRTSWLPDNIASPSLAAIGTRIFFVVGTTRIETTVIGSVAPPKTLVSAPPCVAINQVVAAGNVLGYVQTSPVGDSTSASASATPSASATAIGCARTSRVAWTIWFTDLGGGHPRRMASGIRYVDSAATRMYPVRLAMTPTIFAINRPNSPGLMYEGETIEVRRVTDGKLLWAPQTDRYVANLMLGGSTLAVLERDTGLELNVADAVGPSLFPVARPASTASLSEDGRFVTWDVAADPARNIAAGVATLQLPSGGRTLLPVASNSTSSTPLQPVVSSTPTGPIVAWYSTAQGGAVYPAFRDSANSGSDVFSIVQAPIWIALRGSTLILVTTDRDGGYTVAFALDLSRSGFKAT